MRQQDMKTDLAHLHEHADVWKSLYDLNQNKLESNISKMYCRDLIVPEYKPTEGFTVSADWKLVPVHGKIPDPIFWDFLSKGMFPVNQQMRAGAALEYVYLRDNWHDTVGHVPFLVSSDKYDLMLRTFGLSYRYSPREVVSKALSRLYWATVEFGLIVEDGELRLLGAGLISSYLEGSVALSNSNNTQREFNLAEILSWDYDPYGVQDRHYIVHNLLQITEAARKIAHIWG
jgi:phenylalanine-4-hydroxylase